jgi:acyl-coenzyme A synthetase/AMP-(fatty) acid ligase
MGHRIELGEIEVNVDMLPEIRMSACIYDTKKGKIVLYYVGDVSEKDLTVTLKTKLPRYMLPNRIFRIESMPLTANGKIDRITLKRRYEDA